VLLPLVLALNRKDAVKTAAAKAINETPSQRKDLILGGMVCGFVMFVAGSFQQFGLLYSTVGKSGFITALYMVIVPLLGIFLKRKVGLNVWASVAIAVIGMYFLCINESLTVNTGDVYTLACAFVFAWHIIAIDHYSPKVNGIKLSCVQLFTCSFLSLVTAFIFETPEWGNILAAWFPIFFTGAVSSGVAYTLQILGQKHTSPAVASLLCSLESVFALFAGMLLLTERPSRRELLGCVLMFAAIVFSQVNLTLPKIHNKGG